MSKGILIFAYNSKLNYIDIATVAAKLAKKHLGLPVTVVTDTTEVDQNVFDQVIVQNLNTTSSKRLFKYADGKKDLTEWHNTNRSNAYELSPYDQTLLIDADYLMFNNSLGKLFDTNLEFACYDTVHEISGWAGLQNTARVGYPGLHMQWATVIYFTKNKLAESIFAFMQTIKENYAYYSTIYNFTTELFRNDFTLSISLQALTGYSKNNFTRIPGQLISANTGIDIVDVRPNGEIVFMWTNKDKQCVTKIKNTNVHIMNKRTITEPTILEQLKGLT
jgi:hypothetical protein